MNSKAAGPLARGMSHNPGLQVSLDVHGRQCVVVGGDEEATKRVRGLLDAGANVLVVNPTLTMDLRKLRDSGIITHRGRKFRSTDTKGAFLIFHTRGEDLKLSQKLSDLAQSERFLLWSMDQPHLSTLMMPAVVKCGHLRLAMSTSSASPALASMLRQQCERIFDETFVQFLHWLGDLREQVQNNEPNVQCRRKQLKAAVDGFQLIGKLEYPQAWREQYERSVER